jgi:hypothetical protein
MEKSNFSLFRWGVLVSLSIIVLVGCDNEERKIRVKGDRIELN